VAQIWNDVTPLSSYVYMRRAVTAQLGRCACTSRYYGERCEELDACQSSPCRGHDAVCVNVPPASFRCHCAPGSCCPRTLLSTGVPPWAKCAIHCAAGSYGRLCESRDPCVDRPCRHGGTCVIVDQQLAASSPDQPPAMLVLQLKP